MNQGFPPIGIEAVTSLDQPPTNDFFNIWSFFSHVELNVTKVSNLSLKPNVSATNTVEIENELAQAPGCHQSWHRC